MTLTGNARGRCFALLCALVVTGLTGCGSDGPPSDEVRVVAVTAATAQQARPSLGHDGLAAVRDAAESDRGSFTLVVAGAPDETRILDLTPRRQAGTRSAIEHGPRRPGLIDGAVLTSEVWTGSVAAPSGPPDLLGAIAGAARGTPGTLIVADSGVSATDPIDLRRLGWEADPTAIVEHLRAANQLPDLRGWSVHFVGLGRVDGNQPALGTAQQRWLESFWSTVCIASGARSCHVDPVVGAPVPAASGVRRTAVVPVPVAQTRDLPGGGTTVSLPDSVLGFAPGSDRPGPDASAALGPIVRAVRASHGPVRVDGYVAFWGDDGYRAGLSQARADAVGRLLVEAGVDPRSVTATGRGAADGASASTTAGRFDEQKVVASGLRRVVVTVGDSR